MFTRRHLLTNASLATVALSLPTVLRAAAPDAFAALPAAFETMEKKNGGRLGVYVLNTADGKHTGYRVDERFPMCSTFKFLLVATVLHRVDGKQESLMRQVDLPAKITLGNSPLTLPHAGGSMTVGALCFAALTRSDNTAANVLLETVGGPAEITAAARQLGDTVTRLDRNEPDVNTSIKGDPRDTTTPTATGGLLNKLLLGTALHPDTREQLTKWMEECQTGLDRLRKDLPAGWRAADKTGANGAHTSNDIAVLWPAGRAPVIVTAYITQCPGPEEKRGAMLAQIGKLVREAVA